MPVVNYVPLPNGVKRPLYSVSNNYADVIMHMRDEQETYDDPAQAADFIGFTTYFKPSKGEIVLPVEYEQAQGYCIMPDGYKRVLFNTNYWSLNKGKYQFIKVPGWKEELTGGWFCLTDPHRLSLCRKDTVEEYLGISYKESDVVEVQVVEL